MAGETRAGAVPKLELGNQVDITFLSANSGGAALFSGRRHGGLSIARPKNCQESNLRRQTIPVIPAGRARGTGG